MEQEPRKATDVLLDLESKIDVLMGTIKAMDLNIKVLSNKLNEVMKNLDKPTASPPKIIVEAVQSPTQVIAPSPMPVTDPERAIMVTAESKLPADDAPIGFRRTSRPEGYAGDHEYIARPNVPPPNQPSAFKPPPGRSTNDTVIVPPAKNKSVPKNNPPPVSPKMVTGADTHGIVPVEQRVVDRNGKSVFLADVEVVDTSSGEQISKSRTNGTGKWMAALPLGNYKVTIRKLESLTREKVESIQTIEVNGNESPLKLPMVIIK